MENADFHADYVDKETERFVVPDGAKRIGFHDFWFWDKLRRVVIPASVEEVDDNAFFECGALEAFEVAEDNSHFRTIDGVLFSKDGKTLVKYPEGLKKNVCVVPEGVEKIARRAFYHCVSLTSIVVPQSLKTIAAGAFAECFALKSFDVPKNVGKIGSNAFFLCCKLRAINVAENNERYRSIDGVLFSKGGKTLLKCPEGTETEEYSVPQGVETVEEDAFAHCSALKKIVLPNGVVTIGDGAFSECSSLAEIVLPHGLKTIGDRAFSGGGFGDCRLTSIVLPKSVETLGDAAFYNCPSLKEIVVPVGVKKIGDSAFADCASLTELVISESVEKIEKNAFDNCPDLTIRAPKGSYTERFAKQNGINFKKLS